MEISEINNKITVQPQPYATPQLTVFGDVRSLTATGSINGAEGGGSAMSMIMA